MSGEASSLQASAGIDTTAFKKGVDELVSQMKSIETGFRASAAVMDNWSGTSNGLKERIASLSDKLNLQKQALSTLHSEYDKAVAAQGADSKSAQSLANQMYSMEQKISGTNKSLDKYSSQLKTVEKSEKEAANPLSKLKTGFMQLAEQSRKSTTSISGHFSNLKASVAGFVTGLVSKETIEQIGSLAEEAEKPMAQLDSVLQSTGGAAGVTKQSVLDLANSLSKQTTFENDAVISAQNMLLTFTNIGKNVFPQATSTVLDMSQALGQDTKSSAIQLGKALNDPIKGVTALQRVGVTFTDAQKKQIKAMVDANNTAGAQSLILQELQKEFGGSAKAAGQTFSGQITIMKNSIHDAGEEVAVSLVPIITSVMPSIVKGAQDIAKSITDHKAEIADAVQTAANIVKDIFGFAETHGPLVKDVIIAIVSAVGIWKTAMLVANTISTIHNALTALGIIQSGASAAAKGVEAGATGALTAAQSGLNLAMLPTIGIIAGIVLAVAALAFGAYELVKHWSSVKATFTGLWKDIREGFASFNPVKWGEDLIDGLADGIKGAAAHVKTAVGNVAQDIRSFLHFSKPDTGPLADFDTYGPDMTDSLQKGIMSGVGKLRAAARSAAAAISSGLNVSASVSPSYAGGAQAASTTTNYNQYGAQQEVTVFQVGPEVVTTAVKSKVSTGIQRSNISIRQALGYGV